MITSKTQSAVGGIALLVASSCGPAGTDGGDQHVDGLPQLVYVEEVRIGSIDDPDLGFSDIRGVEVGESGEIYVLESMAREVRVYSPNGTRIRTIGRAGEGPGEFEAPRGLGLFGDTTWVLDGRTRRISWFDPTGELLFETRASQVVVETGMPGGPITLFPARPLPDGFVAAGMSYSSALAGSFSVPVIRFDRRGEVVDTVGWQQREFSIGQIRVGENDLTVPSLRPTSPITRVQQQDTVDIRWSASDGATGLLDVARYRSSVDTLFHARVRYSPIATPATVVDSLLQGRVDVAHLFGVSESEMETAMRSAIEIPPFRPAVRTAHLGRDGAVWVELGTESPDTAHWVIVNSDGTVRGRLALPLQMSIEYSDGSDVWVVDADALDVPWLVHLRIEGPPSHRIR